MPFLTPGYIDASTNAHEYTTEDERKERNEVFEREFGKHAIVHMYYNKLRKVGEEHKFSIDMTIRYVNEVLFEGSNKIDIIEFVKVNNF